MLESLGLSKRPAKAGTHRVFHLATAGILVAAAMVCSASLVRAADWPSKTVHLIVPHPPGGATDTTGRAMAGELSKMWGVSVVVENRGGANQGVAAEYTSRQPPDGYNLLIVADGAMCINKFVYTNLTYDPDKDLTPISRWFTVHSALIVNSRLPVNNLREFVAYMKSNGKKLNYSSPGVGDNSHINFEWLKKRGEFEMLHVPYKGMAPALQGILTGDADAILSSLLTSAQYIESGRMKPIAISGTVRDKKFPQLETFAEAGYPDVGSSFFVGLVAPANTPPAIVKKIADDTRKILHNPAFVAKYIAPFGYELAGDTPEQFGALIKELQKSWKQKIDVAGIKMQM